MQLDIQSLLNAIERQLNWGESSSWQTRDFEKLSGLILEKTGVSLSASTLRRLWGRVAYQHQPSVTTLDALAVFAGFESWRGYVATAPREGVAMRAGSSPARRSAGEPVEAFLRRRRFNDRRLLLAVAVILVTVLLIYTVRARKNPAEPRPGAHSVGRGEYQFSSRPLTRQIPNSVIFTYDAAAASTDSVFIQQSWDPTTRTRVDKAGHVYTSIYYEPGFYQAKLVIGDRVVKEHPLVISSDGWIGILKQGTSRVYLAPAELTHKGVPEILRVSPEMIAKKNMSMEPEAPSVRLFNVGNFEPAALSDFSFQAEVRNEDTGAGACQLTHIVLITDAAPITIPLSAMGCVAMLQLRSVDSVVSGKTADLSGFGVSFRDWVRVGCSSRGGKILFSVNGEFVYATSIPARPVHIVGMAFLFKGAGAVRHIGLSNSKGLVAQFFN